MTKRDFQNILSQNEYVFLDVYADWCGPCNKIAPEIKKLIKDYSHIKFISINFDLLLDLCKELQIKVLPTFILFNEGRVLDKVEKADIDKVIKMLNG